MAKFRATNAPWNVLCLNDPWSVGFVSSLIESRTFLHKEDWEQFYYDSGAKRESLVNVRSENERKILNNHTLKSTHPALIDTLNRDMKNLNLQYGRTSDDLAAKRSNLVR